MTVPEIPKELEPRTWRCPMRAMQAVVVQREAIRPELLRVVVAFAYGGVCGLTFGVNRVASSECGVL
jgi:hypothetical protein